MSVKVNYDSTTGKILGFYPDDIGYKAILEPYIEITEEQHMDCINNQGLRKVDVTTKKIVTCKTPAPTKQQKYAAINAEYSVKQTALRTAAIDAQINGKSLDTVKAAQTKLLEEWKGKIVEVKDA